ncbi:PLP-dependent aminotransferase family protein [Erwinia sp.]|uniref:aminotransferase-like domain-containing protein n=1 Tax=Erwinia citreus TaxID=558 RepID=UPI0028A186C1|nr:PLP-dependent aminotransferase family protein [Erwinia sp.]
MNALPFTRWATRIQHESQRPAYLLIADMIAEGIGSGEFPAHYRLPPLRELAAILGLNYTTVTRGYAEARRRGLIDSRPGLGSFIRSKASSLPKVTSSYEMTMNAPVEPDMRFLEEEMRNGVINLFNRSSITDLMRYQDFGGTAEDKAVAMHWIGQKCKVNNPSEILVCPGIHVALVGLLTLTKRKNSALCVSNLVYPGIKAIASQLNIKLKVVSCDKDGPIPSSLEALCKLGLISSFYINPTLHNPTTLTIPLKRRTELAEICLRYDIAVIEDDAYAALMKDYIPAFAEIIPGLTWYITGLSKCLGPGLRIGFVKCPDKQSAHLLSGILRTLTVMSSPFTNALACQWITDGTAERMLAAVRTEAKQRQKLAALHLAGLDYSADENGYHIWLPIPEIISTNSSDVAAKLREQGISVVSGVAFCTDNSPPNNIRLSLGGAQTRQQCEENLKTLGGLLSNPYHFSSIAI